MFIFKTVLKAFEALEKTSLLILSPALEIQLNMPI